MNDIQKTEKPKEDQIDKTADKGIEIPITVLRENSAEPVVETERADEEARSNGMNYLEQLQRLQAEFQNYRKRTEKERAETYQLAKGDLILNLLTVLDDLERMSLHHEENGMNGEGVQLILQKMKKILTDEGLEVIETANQPFNPECHEAVGVEETGREQDGMVVEEWQKGYKFKERLLRPSRVKVGQYTGKDGDD